MKKIAYVITVLLVMPVALFAIYFTALGLLVDPLQDPAASFYPVKALSLYALAGGIVLFSWFTTYSFSKQ